MNKMGGKSVFFVRGRPKLTSASSWKKVIMDASNEHIAIGFDSRLALDLS